MVFWTLATWILTPILIGIMGFDGVGLASALIASSVVGVVYLVKKQVQFSILPAVIPPGIATIVMGIGLWFLGDMLIRDFPTFFLVIVLGAMLYGGTIILLAKNQLLADFRMLKENIRA